MIPVTVPEWMPFKDFDGKISLDGINIFRIAVNECYAGIVLNMEKILQKDELSRASKFFHTKDKNNYLVRKYYLRKILSCFLTEAPEELQFSTTIRKKPVLQNIEFNVSHSNDYAVIVVSSNPVGIDIEYIHTSFTFDSLLESCFNAEERSFVGTGRERKIRFYSLWTRKEAVLKATAEGIIDNLASLNGLESKVFRNAKTFNLNTFYCDKDYLLSLATLDSIDSFKYWHVSE
jgi:4'-phosphopantetheinyl transferase